MNDCNFGIRNCVGFVLLGLTFSLQAQEFGLYMTFLAPSEFEAGIQEWDDDLSDYCTFPNGFGAPLVDFNEYIDVGTGSPSDFWCYGSEVNSVNQNITSKNIHPLSYLQVTQEGTTQYYGSEWLALTATNPDGEPSILIYLNKLTPAEYLIDGCTVCCACASGDKNGTMWLEAGEIFDVPTLLDMCAEASISNGFYNIYTGLNSSGVVSEEDTGTNADIYSFTCPNG